MKFSYLSALAVVASFGLSAAAHADETGKGSFAVTAVVPAYCEINSDAFFLDGANGHQTGSVFEACNTPDGFQVAASYRELSPTEHIVFSYAGSSRVLNASGWTSIANRTGARLGTRFLGVDYSSLEAPVAINLSVTYL
jgi:hypothetical protein